MRSARIHGPGDVRLAEETVPAVGPGRSLVRVRTVGLCGSDLHWYAEGGIGTSTLSRPLVAGHEFAGVVEGGELDGRRRPGAVDHLHRSGSRGLAVARAR